MKAMRKSRPFLVLACVLLLSGAARADFVDVHNASIPFTDTDYEGYLLTFPKFDSSLGQLTKVEIQVAAGLHSTLTLTNRSIRNITGMAAPKVIMSVEYPFVGADNIELASATAAHFTLGPLQTSAPCALEGSTTDLPVSYTGGQLAFFGGPGTFSIPVSAFAWTEALISGGNWSLDQSTQAEARGTVRYTYVPEPALLGIALLSLPLLRGRRP